MGFISNYDIIICGAGPAGSTCALALANSGLKVALIDKAVFPRNKVCGDALAAYVPKVLNTIDPDLEREFMGFSSKQVVHTMRIFSGKGKAYDLVSAEEGFIAPRFELDNFLHQKACALKNVSDLSGVHLKSVEIDGSRVKVQTTEGKVLTAKLFIGCDGAQGISSKQPGNIKKDNKHYFAAIRAYFKGVKHPERKVFELHFLRELKTGYFWIFPLHDGRVNVGLAMLSSRISEKKINLKTELQRIMHTSPGIMDRFSEAQMDGEVDGFGLPLGSVKRAISGERFMLCGDAASLINPLTGEGIGQAMISGRYAGWQARKCFEENNFSATFLKAYDEAVYKKVWKEHRNHLFIRKIISAAPVLFDAGLKLEVARRRFMAKRSNR